jgi:hypothetical protein
MMVWAVFNMTNPRRKRKRLHVIPRSAKRDEGSAFRREKEQIPPRFARRDDRKVAALVGMTGRSLRSSG